jgi:protein farnesyltransferase subunit beta
MPVAASSRKPSRRVRFPTSKESTARTNLAIPRFRNGASKQQTVQKSRGIYRASGDAAITMTTVREKGHFDIPPLFKELPLIRDLLMTESSRVQDDTVELCLPFLSGTAPSLQPSELNQSGIPKLLKDDHDDYLYDALEDYPANFVGIDSSRPWMVYWALAGLTLLGEDLTSYRER